MRKVKPTPAELRLRKFEALPPKVRAFVAAADRDYSVDKLYDAMRDSGLKEPALLLLAEGIMSHEFFEWETRKRADETNSVCSRRAYNQPHKIRARPYGMRRYG